MKLNSFWTAKETIDKMKRQTTEWEKQSASDISHKGLVFTIYKKLTQINIEKINKVINKWAKDVIRYCSTEDIQIAKRRRERG